MEQEDDMMAQLFDAVLVLTMMWLAWRSLADRDLFRAVLKFVALGMLLTVTWVRLRAPDVALAEAAVGSALMAVGGAFLTIRLP